MGGEKEKQPRGFLLKAALRKRGFLLVIPAKRLDDVDLEFHRFNLVFSDGFVDDFEDDGISLPL